LLSLRLQLNILKLAKIIKLQAHYTKGTKSVLHLLNCFLKINFTSLHSVCGFYFTIPSRYYTSLSHTTTYLSLEGGSPFFKQRFKFVVLLSLLLYFLTMLASRTLTFFDTRFHQTSPTIPKLVNMFLTLITFAPSYLQYLYWFLFFRY